MGNKKEKYAPEWDISAGRELAVRKHSRRQELLEFTETGQLRQEVSSKLSADAQDLLVDIILRYCEPRRRRSPQIQYQTARSGAGMKFIDYPSILRDDHTPRQWAELDKVYTKLRELAMKLNIAIIVKHPVASPPRSPERPAYPGR